MNYLSDKQRVQVVVTLVKGNSIRAIVRMTGFANHVWSIEEIIALQNQILTEKQPSSAEKRCTMASVGLAERDILAPL